MESESRQNSGPQHKLLHDQKKKALEGRLERERETQVLSLYAKELSVAVRIVVKVEGSARVLCCLCASVFFASGCGLGLIRKSV